MTVVVKQIVEIVGECNFRKTVVRYSKKLLLKA